MRRYILKNKAMYIVYFILMIIVSFMGTYFAFVISNLLDYVVNNDMQGLKDYLVFAIVFVVATVVLEFLFEGLRYRMRRNAKKSLKADLFKAIMEQPARLFEQYNTGEYLNKITTQCDMYDELYFANYLRTPVVIFSFIFAAAASVLLEPMMLLIMVVLALITAVIMKNITRILKKSTAAYTEAAQEYTSFTKDAFTGYRTIKAFDVMDKILTRHSVANKLVENKKCRNMTNTALCSYIGMFIGLLSTVLITGIACIYAIEGKIAISAVFAFSQLIGKIISPINSASDIYSQFVSSRVIKKEFEELLTPVADNRSQRIDSRVPKISIKNLSFSYDGKTNIINSLNCEFRPGNKYAVIGGSGCGKSTLLSLMLGMYDDFEGSIHIDGKSIKDINMTSLRKTIGYVSQEAFIFDGTLKNNITLYCDYSEEQLKTAIDNAGLREFVNSLPDGINTYIKENGKNISGGQKQRINYARVLLRGYGVLLLDEFTAHLDAANSKILEDAVLSMKDVTVISVEHKLKEDSLNKYDEVIMLKM